MQTSAIFVMMESGHPLLENCGNHLGSVGPRTSPMTELSLMARVMIINHWILVALWFLLTLWVGDPAQLKVIKTTIIKFLWAGQKDSARHRVDAAIVTREKKHGGLGVLSITEQVIALAGKNILWTITAGGHLLKTIIQHRIRALSLKRWG